MGVKRGTWKDLEDAEAEGNYKGAGLWQTADYEFLNYAALFFFPLLKE